MAIYLGILLKCAHLSKHDITIELSAISTYTSRLCALAYVVNPLVTLIPTGNGASCNLVMLQSYAHIMQAILTATVACVLHARRSRLVSRLDFVGKGMAYNALILNISDTC